MLLVFFLFRFHSASLEEGKEKEDTESKSEATGMLSPSEVVKMRKKARLVTTEPPKENAKETKGKAKKAASEKADSKKGKAKEIVEKKSKEVTVTSGKTGKKVEKDNIEDKKLKNYREKRKCLTKKVRFIFVNLRRATD